MNEAESCEGEGCRSGLGVSSWSCVHAKVLANFFLQCRNEVESQHLSLLAIYSNIKPVSDSRIFPGSCLADEGSHLPGVW
jgi:hypothetical protein